MPVPLQTVKDMLIMAAQEWQLKTPVERLRDLTDVNGMRGIAVARGAELLQLVDQTREFIAAHLAGVYVSELYGGNTDGNITSDVTSARTEMYDAILEMADWPALLEEVATALERTEPSP